MTDSNTVSRSLATLGASGWVTNELYGKGVTPARKGNTFVAIGDSITARYGLIQQVGATSSVVGDGANAVFTLASSANLQDGKLNFLANIGTPFDGKILSTTNINVNSFSVPSSLVGNPAAIPVWNNQSRISERGWLGWAMAYLKGQGVLLNCGAIGSSNVDDAAASLNAQAIAYAPDYCFCLLGVNDIANVTPDALLTKVKLIYARLLNAGITPIPMTILPLHQTFATFATIMPRILQFNWLLKSYCAQAGLFLIDAAEAITDFAQADGRALAGAIQGTAGDFIHPSTYGARLVGKYVASKLSPILPPGNVFTNSQADNVGANASNLNLLDQGPWTLTGGSASGTGVSGAAATPAGFAVTSSGVVASTCVVTSGARTVGSDGDAIGNNLILTMTGAEANAIFTVTMADVTSRIQVGRNYRYRFSLRLSGSSGSNLIRMLATMLTTYNGTQRGYISAFETDASPTVMPYADDSYMVESPIFQIPVSANSGFAPFVQFQFAGAGTPVVAYIGRCTFVPVP